MKKNQKRRTRRNRRQKRPGWAVSAVVLAAVVFTAGLVWLGNRPANPGGETVTVPTNIAQPSADSTALGPPDAPGETVTIPTSIARPSADSTALGPPDAPVLVEEFSDFQ